MEPHPVYGDKLRVVQELVPVSRSPWRILLPIRRRSFIASWDWIRRPSMVTVPSAS